MKVPPRKVLLVDSEMLIHLAVSQAYRDSGPYFITSASVSEALRKMEIFKFDLFLLALDQKDEDSLQLLKIINDHYPAAPVILMTNKKTEYSELIDRIEETKKQGTWQLIEKPFNMDILTVLIDRCLFESVRKDAELSELQKSSEKRISLRNSHVQTVHMFIDASERGYQEETSVKATLTDVSDGGFGLITKYPLKKAQPVRFASPSDTKEGIVAWATVMDNCICRAGIQFC